jgi:CBS domain-containing protein
MNRTDAHLDAMLRHLGAAYYESLQGRATADDVTRAVATVAEEVSEHARPAAEPAGPRKRGGWARMVSDVMTTSVITVDRTASYEEIAKLLTENQVSGLPVLGPRGEVAGIVTEADLLAVQAENRRRLLSAQRWASSSGAAPDSPLTARTLMTMPAITIAPDATIAAAANLMNGRHLRLLPVVDDGGTLLGVVSRRDLLGVFVRPDEEVAADVRKLLADVLRTRPADVEATVRDGIVTLTGTLAQSAGHDVDRVPLAIRLMWDIDGVVDIINRLGGTRPGAQPGTARVPQLS